MGGDEMTDKINIIVERGGEFHKYVFGDSNCKVCSLNLDAHIHIDTCAICGSLCGHFEKAVEK
jgi:hypothetical protein